MHTHYEYRLVGQHCGPNDHDKYVRKVVLLYEKHNGWLARLVKKVPMVEKLERTFISERNSSFWYELPSFHNHPTADNFLDQLWLRHEYYRGLTK